MAKETKRTQLKSERKLITTLIEADSVYNYTFHWLIDANYFGPIVTVVTINIP